MSMVSGPGLQGHTPDRWTRLKARTKDAARVPLWLLVLFSSAIGSWLGGWLVWRAGQYLFEKYLATPW